MKITIRNLTASFAAIAAVASLQATDVTVTNFNDAGDGGAALTNMSGSAFAAGQGLSLFIGSISDESAFVDALGAADTSTAFGLFTSFGSVPVGDLGGDFFVDGLVQSTISDSILAGSALNGSNVIGWLSTSNDPLDAAAEHLVLKSTTLFEADATVGPFQTASFNPSTSAEVLWGDFGLHSVDIGFGAGPEDALSSKILVPEPSTYALLGLGAIMIFFYARRRK